MSSRHRKKMTNDIFDMISENDEDIQFDEHGILKVIKKSKSTHVMVNRLRFLMNSIEIENLFIFKYFRHQQLMMLFIHQQVLYHVLPMLNVLKMKLYQRIININSFLSRNERNSKTMMNLAD